MLILPAYWLDAFPIFDTGVFGLKRFKADIRF
jgi:hypothetical protein